MIPFSLVYSAVTSFLGSATRSTSRFVSHVLLRSPTFFFSPPGCVITHKRACLFLSPFFFPFLSFFFSIFLLIFFFSIIPVLSRFLILLTLPDCLVCLFPRGRFSFTPSKFTTWPSNDGRCYRETNSSRLWLLFHICGDIMGRGDVAVPTPRRNIAAWDV